MGHNAENVASKAADSGDIFERSVGIRFLGDFAFLVGVTKHDAIVALQFFECRLIAKVISFHVADGDGQHFAFVASVRKRRVVALHSHVYGLADIFQPDVAHQRSRQQSGLTQNLEAIADAENQPAAIRELADRFHDWRKFRDRPSPEIVAKSESSGDNNGVTVLQVMRIMPEESDGLFRNVRDSPVGIVIAVGTGENNDAEFHRKPFPKTILQKFEVDD
jgi:hypothetical protein